MMGHPAGARASGPGPVPAAEGSGGRQGTDPGPGAAGGGGRLKPCEQHANGQHQVPSHETPSVI